MLLTGAAGEARQFYSAAYIRELERRSPFRFEFLRMRRRRFARNRGMLERLVGALSAWDVSRVPDRVDVPAHLFSLAL